MLIKKRGKSPHLLAKVSEQLKLEILNFGNDTLQHYETSVP